MALSIVDNGVGNIVNIDPEVMAQGEGVIFLNGSRIVVEISDGCSLSGASVDLGNDCSFHVGAGCRLARLEAVVSAGGSISIGAGCSFTWHARLLIHEPARITFGAGCLIASDTLFTASDMHSIIDRSTGRRINPPADIIVGDQVWIAHAATLLKGTSIGDGSIVGLKAVVSGSIPANCLASGVPARVLKENVTWNPALLPY